VFEDLGAVQALTSLATSSPAVALGGQAVGRVDAERSVAHIIADTSPASLQQSSGSAAR